MYSNKNIVLHELIGLKVKILKASDKKQSGSEGIVVDETRHTLLVKRGASVKRIIKKTATFKFYAGNKAFTVDGKEIDFRPEERTERGLKFYKNRVE
jgi:ribonuclease P protein subunit POP4